MNNYKFILATILILPQGVSYASQNQADGPQIKVIGVESKEKDSILPDPTPRKVEISGMSRYDCVYEYKINVGGARPMLPFCRSGNRFPNSPTIPHIYLTLSQPPRSATPPSLKKCSKRKRTPSSSLIPKYGRIYRKAP